MKQLVLVAMFFLVSMPVVKADAVNATEVRKPVCPYLYETAIRDPELGRDRDFRGVVAVDGNAKVSGEKIR